jgi:hypothetical protein
MWPRATSSASSPQHPEIAKKGVLLRKYGQEVIRMTAGKRVHGTGSVPGGVNKSLSADERAELLKDAYQMVAWSRDAVALIRGLFEQNLAEYNAFGRFRSAGMCLVRADGAMDLYHGGLRARDIDGKTLFDHFDYGRYWDVIAEDVKPWSYMKFPFFKSLGADDGSYRVGPLSRVTMCDNIPTPLADKAREEFLAFDGGSAAGATLGYHWARMIEMLHAAETIKDLLHDDDITGSDLMATGERQERGVGVIEAPRGTLIHHYRVDENDQVIRANLIVSTTHNTGHEHGGARSGEAIPRRPRSHRGPAQPHRSRHPRLRSLPVLRHPCAGGLGGGSFRSGDLFHGGLGGSGLGSGDLLRGGGLGSSGLRCSGLLRGGRLGGSSLGCSDLLSGSRLGGSGLGCSDLLCCGRFGSSGLGSGGLLHDGRFGSSGLGSGGLLHDSRLGGSGLGCSDLLRGGRLGGSGLGCSGLGCNGLFRGSRFGGGFCSGHISLLFGCMGRPLRLMPQAATRESTRCVILEQKKV